MKFRLLRSMIQGVCQSVCHAASLFKHGWKDRGPAWGGDSWEPNEHYVRRNTNFAHRFNAAFAKLLWPLVNLAASNKVARSYMFYRQFFLANRLACDQTADRRRVKSIGLRCLEPMCVARIIRIDISTIPTVLFTGGQKVRHFFYVFRPHSHSKRSDLKIKQKIKSKTIMYSIDVRAFICRRSRVAMGPQHWDPFA